MNIKTLMRMSSYFLSTLPKTDVPEKGTPVFLFLSKFSFSPIASTPNMPRRLRQPR